MKLTKKSLWALVLTLALALFLAACAGGNDDAGETTPDTGTEEGGTETGTETGGEEGSGGGDLIIAVLSDASSLDPHGSNDVPSSVVQANIYETLVNRNENNEIIEALQLRGSK